MKAYWHYYIIESSETTRQLTIVSQGKEVLFKKPEQVELPNGGPAYRISSQNQEFVQETDDTYEFSLALIDENSDQPSELVKLPFPNRAHSRIDQNEASNSDIYIYL